MTVARTHNTVPTPGLRKCFSPDSLADSPHIFARGNDEKEPRNHVEPHLQCGISESLCQAGRLSKHLRS
eukprot:5451490-Alexandrium_andersonii.AAC.1